MLTHVEFLVSDKSEKVMRESTEEIFGECEIQFVPKCGRVKLAHVTQKHITGKRKYIVAYNFVRETGDKFSSMQYYTLYIGYERNQPA